MNAGWSRIRLGDVARVKHGFAFSGMGESRDIGLPVVIGIGNFDYEGGFRFGSTTLKRFRGDIPAEYILKPGDVLLAMTCQTAGGEILGIPGTVPADGRTYLHNQRLGKLEVIRPELVDLKFLYHVARSKPFNEYLFATASGSKILHTSPGRIENFIFSAPPRDEQLEIAATLSALDEKIESNRRAVGLLNELLLLEFRRVVTRDHFVEAALSGYVAITKGVSYKSIDLKPSRRALVTLKSIDRAGGYKADGLKQYVGPYKPQQVLQPGDIVVAQTDLTQGAEVVGRAVRVPAEASADTLIASLDLAIVRPSGDMPVEYLQGILTDETFRQHCRSRTSGTTVLHLSSDAIPAYNAPIVSAPIQRRYSEFARPLIKRIDSYNREIEKLLAARDGLLPDLLSGRIRFHKGADAVG